jgi:phosphosulfolactate phosphohydrolase-like enzyme
MTRQTRLVLIAPNGARVVPEVGSEPIALDLSHIPNADAVAPMAIAVEQRCDLGSWHVVGGPVPLPLYDGVLP